MKITFHNFRCHRDAEYTIPTEGLVQIGGRNGTGKSTLLNGMVFALYGSCAWREGKSRKMYSHGTKSCHVTLEIYNMHIYRSRNPNRLVVKHDGMEYEDDAAQGLIQGMMGMNFQEFMTSSYVIQRQRNSVISMTPAEQVKFIQTLAFSDDIHLEYREKFRVYVKECRDGLIRVKGRLQLITEQLRVAQSQLPDHPPDLEGLDPKKLHLKSKAVHRFLEECEKKMKVLTKELTRKRKKEKLYQKLKDKKRELETQADHYQRLLDEMGKVPDETDIRKFKKEVEERLETLDFVRKYQAYQTSLNQFKEARSAYFTSRNGELEHLREELPSPESVAALKEKYQDIEGNRERYEKEGLEAKKAQDDKKNAVQTVRRIMKEVKEMFGLEAKRIKKFDILVSFIEKKRDAALEEEGVLEEKLEGFHRQLGLAEVTGRCYTCPHCDIPLCFSDDHETLVHVKEGAQDTESPSIITTSITQSKEELEKIIQCIESSDSWLGELEVAIPLARSKVVLVPTFDLQKAIDIKENITRIELVQKNIQELEDRLSKKTLSAVLERLFSDLKDRKRSFPSKFKPTQPVKDLEIDIEELRKKWSEAQDQYSCHGIYLRKIKAFHSKIEDICADLPSDRLHPEQRPVTKIEEELTTAQEKYQELAKQFKNIRQQMAIIIRFESYQKDLQAAEDLEKSQKETQDKISDAEWRLEGAIGLEKAGREAEILAMEKTISSINEHARVYLDQMFEEPISVRLESTKALISRKGQLKTQINTVVRKSGHQYDSIGELCGGEKQFCELAFLLAVNDMLGSNILMLDECINHLDPGNNQAILSKLSEIAFRDKKGVGKLILMASHEAIEGVFDHIIRV